MRAGCSQPILPDDIRWGSWVTTSSCSCSSSSTAAISRSYLRIQQAARKAPVGTRTADQLSISHWKRCTRRRCLALSSSPSSRRFVLFLFKKELASIAEKASIEDVMRILAAARKQDLLHLWSVCSKLVARSGLSSDVLRKHIPPEVVADIESIRSKCGYGREQQQQQPQDALDDQRIRRMQKALDSSDVELVRLMVMGEGLDLDRTLAIHYAVSNCSRKVVKNLLELGAANVNMVGADGRTPLHIAAEMADPEMIAVLLDHHADPHMATTTTSATPLSILQNLASEALAVGAITGLTSDHNKLRLCLDLLESAAAVQPSSRDDEESSLLSSSESQSQQQQQQVHGMIIGSSSASHSEPDILVQPSFYSTWSEQDEVIDPMPLLLPNAGLSYFPNRTVFGNVCRQLLPFLEEKK